MHLFFPFTDTLKHIGSEVVVFHFLDALESLVWPLELGVYEGFKTQALQRISTRDADDWPVLACAMAIGCPVWTESGRGTPSMRTVQRFASAVGARAVVRMEPLAAA